MIRKPSKFHPSNYYFQPVKSKMGAKGILTNAASILISAALLLTSCGKKPIPTPTPPASDQILAELESSELVLLESMKSTITESLGSEGEAILSQHLEGRQATLSEMLNNSGAFRPNSKPPGMASLLPGEDQQAALLGTIFSTIISLAFARGGGKDPQPVNETKTEGATTTTVKLAISSSGSKITVEGEVTISTTEDGASVNEKATIKTTLDACPDVNGSVAFNVDMRWEMTASAGGKSVSSQMTGNAQVTGTVNDNADLSQTDINLTSTSSQQVPGIRHAEMIGSYAEVRSSDHIDNSNRSNSTTKDELARTEGEATQETVDNGVKSANIMRIIAQAVLVFAQEKWQNGFCVEIVLEGVNDTNPVDTSSTTPFKARVRHKWEGTELPGPLSASLSGDKSVEPTAKTDAPVDYVYISGPKNEGTATVTLETRSRRGAAKKEVKFITGVHNWRPVDDVLPWKGTICYTFEPFTITTDFPFKESYTFSGDTSVQGTVSMVQDIGQGCEVKGDGTYTITFTEGDKTEGDIAISIEPTMYCPEFTSPLLEKTILHILIEPYNDPACKTPAP